MLRDRRIFYWWRNRGSPISLVTYFYYSFFEFYSDEEGKKTMMDHLKRRGKILVELVYIGVCI